MTMQEAPTQGERRSIPAWAGNTRTMTQCRTQGFGHGPSPRGRGNPRTPSNGADGYNYGGPSPRGRGTPTSNAMLEHPNQLRSIPAWAGNTVGLGLILRHGPVHPRVGGEHSLLRVSYATAHGSSPRGRGTRRQQGQLAPAGRFIPAWAGNTTIRIASSSLATVHPRVGGEHAIERETRMMHDGSSPRGRGTPSTAPVCACSYRFIPAWAGNTQYGPGVCLLISVHPRVGGEHLFAEHREHVAIGSSPRGRGTLFS